MSTFLTFFIFTLATLSSGVVSIEKQETDDDGTKMKSSQVWSKEIAGLKTAFISRDGSSIICMAKRNNVYGILVLDSKDGSLTWENWEKEKCEWLETLVSHDKTKIYTHARSSEELWCFDIKSGKHLATHICPSELNLTEANFDSNENIYFSNLNKKQICKFSLSKLEVEVLVSMKEHLDLFQKRRVSQINLVAAGDSKLVFAGNYSLATFDYEKNEVESTEIQMPATIVFKTQVRADGRYATGFTRKQIEMPKNWEMISIDAAGEFQTYKISAPIIDLCCLVPSEKLLIVPVKNAIKQPGEIAIQKFDGATLAKIPWGQDAITTIDIDDTASKMIAVNRLKELALWELTIPSEKPVGGKR